MKRDAISAGLNHMSARGLLIKSATAVGIVYQESELTAAFIGLLTARYAKLLIERAFWVEDQFGSMSDDQLKRYMTQNVGRWGAEFERLASLRELELGLDAS